MPTTHEPARPDEDVQVFPDEWRSELHPRRGGRAVAAVEPAASAVETVNARILDRRAGVEDVLALPGSEAEIVDAVRAHEGGTANPRGAAALAAVAAAKGGNRHGGLALAVDAWAAEHGPAFAACAFVESGDIYVDWSSAGDRQSWRGVRSWQPGDHLSPWWASPGTARRLRTLLAQLSDTDHAEAVARLAAYRRTPLQRLVAAYLAPTELDWVDDCCRNPPPGGHAPELRWMLLCSVSSGTQLAMLGGRPLDTWHATSLGVFATLVEGVGTAIVPLLDEMLDGDINGGIRARILDVLATVPTDEAFQVLVDRIGERHVLPTVIDAAVHFPVRAVRLLAPASLGTSGPAALADEALREHLLADPGLADVPLPDDARAVAKSIVAGDSRVEEAPPEALPPLLVDPPWNRAREAAKPFVLAVPSAPAEPVAAWEPGEREAWSRAPQRWWRIHDGDWPVLLEKFRSGEMGWYEARGLFVDGPEEEVRPLLKGWVPDRLYGAEKWIRPIVGRFGLDAFPLALHAARAKPATCGKLLLPFLDAEAAALAAGWLARLKSARGAATAWLDRHGVAAAAPLLPAALGTPGDERSSAEGALRHVAAAHGADAVIEVARAHGDDAAAAIGAMLAADPLDLLPARMPKPGGWADPALLPQILLRGGDRALPRASVAHVLMMLALSRPGDVYPGVDVVRELCDPESLAEFGWAVFRRWRSHGEPSKDGWALTQLGRFGDDETVRRLAPVIRAWPGEGGHTKAVGGLNVLAEIGSDVALMHLHGIAQKVRFQGLKARAQEKIEEVAAGLELTAEQLADRLVPGFGLDADGGLTLDYGPRRFRVGFDEQLKPYVRGDDGKRRKALPKPGAKDDADLAPAAYKRFAGLKKDVRTVASDQIRRLEAAMVGGRRWTPEDFHRFFVDHPLLWHIARRLVWTARRDDGTDLAFRVAEDRTLAGVDDDAVILPASAAVGIVHPLDLGDALDAWTEVFADYEILQPFPQLGRAVHLLDGDERADERLRRFEGVTVPVGKILGLERRGWERGMPMDAGVERWISRQVGPDRHVVIDLDPGIMAGGLDIFPEQRLQHVWLGDEPGDFSPWRDVRRRFGELDPATASEVLADLTELTGPTEGEKR